ncbi:MAG: DUF4249 domain-containing protein [Flavobacteriaceae bacterium]
MAVLLLGIGTLFNSCIEPFTIESSESFDSTLVVEATITNEEIQQVIKISRAYNLDQEGPNPESNAKVKVIDDALNEYVFQETEPGNYVSIAAFAAKSGIGYRLLIVTKDGRTYSTEPQIMTSGSEIKEVYPVRETNDFGEDGMAIYLDAQGTEADANYFRYEYEETFKIVAPFYATQNAIIINDEWPNFEYGLEERQTRPICYGNRLSTRIVLTNTENQASNSIDRFRVKFIPREDYVISHRYSILVKQYTQTSSAYSYYEALRDFSQSENPFSENQPGFLEGNVFSELNKNEKVIGFFNVSAVSTKRMFFNYEDFYPDEPLPPYPSYCTIVEPNPGCPGPGCIPSLIRNIREEATVFYDLSGGPDADPRFGGFQMVPYDCGDCTKLGSNTVPDFWVE